MKIKEKNVGMILYGVVFLLLYLIVLLKTILANHDYLRTISVKDAIGNLFFVILGVSILIAAIYGSYIEVKNNLIIRNEGFSKKKFHSENIKRIYCAHHVFLGPTMFLEYQVGGAAVIKEKKLLVLDSYLDRDKKALLYFLAEKYPDIEQDHNCRKIRNGEKVLTTWRDN